LEIKDIFINNLIRGFCTSTNYTSWGLKKELLVHQIFKQIL